MYKSFQVRDFRCFKNLTIKDLGLVNLVAGVNNIGKTALLEALFLHSGGYNPALTMNLNAFRGIESIKIEFGRWLGTPWDSIFNDFDANKEVELVGENDTTGRRVIRLKVLRKPEDLAEIDQYVQTRVPRPDSIPISSEAAQVLQLQYEQNGKMGKYHMIFGPRGMRVIPFPPSPPFPAFFQADFHRISPQEEAERLGKMEIEGNKDLLLDVLRLMEPRLTRLAMVVLSGQPMLHGEAGLNRLIPLALMGAGMVRLAGIVANISNAKNGIVLIDEFGNGIHYSILPHVWKAIAKIARQLNTQIFATTHSFECIVAAHTAFSEEIVYDFRLHRLQRTKDTIEAVTYNREALEGAIATGLEVR
jgi:hypothetical protein